MALSRLVNFIGHPVFFSSIIITIVGCLHVVQPLHCLQQLWSLLIYSYELPHENDGPCSVCSNACELVSPFFPVLAFCWRTI